MNESEAMLHQLLNIGECMLSCGGEVNRVEDTLNRIGRAYGAVNMNVFVITSSIIVTMTMPDGNECTQARRIVSAGSTDFLKLERLNHLSRCYCAAPTPPEILQADFEKINCNLPRRIAVYLGSMLAAGSFAIFFGGTLADGFAGAFSAILICLLQDFLGPLCKNKISFNLMCAFIIGIIICLIGHLFSFVHTDEIMIGDIMLLIPGIAMTNSIRDILVGDTISGIMRFIETLVWSGALAVGFMGAILLMGG
ncbi:MAG: threonine/serine exporter family protein [Lachnospiraceae bacterium]